MSSTPLHLGTSLLFVLVTHLRSPPVSCSAMTTTDRTTRRVYSTEQLHKLRGSFSAPKLREAIEEHDREDAELVKGSLLPLLLPPPQPQSLPPSRRRFTAPLPQVVPLMHTALGTAGRALFTPRSLSSPSQFTRPIQVSCPAVATAIVHHVEASTRA